MKTIGLLGGMSWESTEQYYRQINLAIKRRLGGLHSAKIVLISVDFHEIEQLQRQGDWTGAGRALALAGQQAVAAGAQGLVLCTNTMHKVADAIAAAVDVPLLHIADAAAQQICPQYQQVGLLGTQFTMAEDFYRGHLRDRYGLTVQVPDAAGQAIVHRVIYEELCCGIISEASRAEFLRIIQQLQAQGAAAVIAGCTEITLLVQQQHTAVPLFDTTAIHAEAAAAWALTP